MNFPSIGQEQDKSKNIWIKAGESVTGVFIGDVYEFKIHWVEKKKLPCLGPDCGYCGTGIKTAFQFRINFIHKDEAGDLQAGIYEQDWFTYNRLAALNNQYPLEKNFVKIYKGEENGYKVDLFERTKEVSADILEKIKAVELNILSKQNVTTKPKNDEDIPF